MGNSVQEGQRKIWIALFIVVALTFLFFLPDLSNHLLDWDDGGYIIENYHIKSLSFDTVSWAFGSFYLNYWAPLTWLSLALDYAIGGLNPVVYHITNNILHALNAGLFFLISLYLLRIHLAEPRTDLRTPRMFTPDTAIYCSALAAVLFAIHPLRVESVAWATERKDVLSLFFGLLAVLAYLKHQMAVSIIPEMPGRKPLFISSRYYWLAVTLYALSLLSKTLMVSLPLILLVLDWFPLRRLARPNRKAVFFDKIPFAFLAGVTSAIAMKSQAAVIFSLDEINLTTRILNAFHSIASYLRLTIWPLGLSPFYVHPMNIPAVTPEYAVPIAVFIMITVSCLLLVKRLPLLMAAWLTYLTTLLPFLGITQVGPQAMAARFTYLPGLPAAFLLAVGLMTAFNKIARMKTAVACLATAAVFVIVVNGYLTVKEISYWKDDVTLWARVIDLAPHTSGRAYFQRSHAYALRGDWQNALTDINEALAIAVRKKYRALHEIYDARAAILVQLGDLDDAISDYTSALLTAGPRDRAFILRARGDLYDKIGRRDLARDDFRMVDSLSGYGAANHD